MKKILIALTLTFFANIAAAEHPLMERFDLNSNGLVTAVELEQAGCSIKSSLFKAADKNSDGTLTKKELLKAKSYIATKKRCPKVTA